MWGSEQDNVFPSHQNLSTHGAFGHVRGPVRLLVPFASPIQPLRSLQKQTGVPPTKERVKNESSNERKLKYLTFLSRVRPRSQRRRRARRAAL